MNRRSFLKKCALAVGCAAVGLNMLREPKQPVKASPDGLTLEKLQKAKAILDQHDAAWGDNRCFIVSDEQMKDLLNMDSSETNNLIEKPTFMGYRLMRSNRIKLK